MKQNFHSKWFYREWEISQKLSHYDYAFHYLRKSLLKGYDEDYLLTSVQYSGTKFASVGLNSSAKLSGKISVEIKGKGTEHFSIRLLLSEIKKHKKQLSLF